MTTIYLDVGSSSPWTVPSDWNSASNTIECLAGGGGGAGNASSAAGSGAGAGQYSSISNLSLTPGGTVAFGVGAAGTGGASSSPYGGSNGGDTWFNGTSLSSASVSAGGGKGGPNTLRLAVWVELAVLALPNMTGAPAALVVGRAVAVAVQAVPTGLALRAVRRERTLAGAVVVMAAGLLPLALTAAARSTALQVARPRMVQRVVPLAFILPPRPQEMARMGLVVVPAAPSVDFLMGQTAVTALI